MKPFTLGEAAAAYFASLPPQQVAESQAEVNKFLRWCGSTRPPSKVLPQEVATYAEELRGEARRMEAVRGFLAYLYKEKLTPPNLAPHLRYRKTPSKVAKAPPHKKPESVALTKEGFERIRGELSSLYQEKLKATEAVKIAREDKDFRENAPLEAAREQQGQVESRIKELEETLNRAVEVEAREQKAAGLGASVTVRDLETGERISFILVDPREVNPARGKISLSSPIGQALINRGRGEEVEIPTPARRLRYLIEEVR